MLLILFMLCWMSPKQPLIHGNLDPLLRNLLDVPCIWQTSYSGCSEHELFSALCDYQWLFCQFISRNLFPVMKLFLMSVSEHWFRWSLKENYLKVLGIPPLNFSNPDLPEFCTVSPQFREMSKAWPWISPWKISPRIGLGQS